MGTRRQFSREFKLEAVRLVKERGVSVPQAARDLEVHENVLRKWVSAEPAAAQEIPAEGEAGYEESLVDGHKMLERAIPLAKRTR
jgi:transposase